MRANSVVPKQCSPQPKSKEPLPSLKKGQAAHWPAVQNWRLLDLAQRAPALPIKLVKGDREQDKTQFIQSFLPDYLKALALSPHQSDIGYLKEFSLLKALPELQQDLRPAEIFPTKNIYFLESWIGPAHSCTGLHYDHFDNKVLQVIGHKRVTLFCPGTVERLGWVSKKYDQWAVLSQRSATEVFAQLNNPQDRLTFDLAPGDVLSIPAGWWHDIVNLTASVSLSGFHSPRLTLYKLATGIQIRHMLHRIGWLSTQGCTCHQGKVT
jgi:hypothetical protein